MTPPSNAGGEGREVLAREVLAEQLHGFGELRRAILSGDDVTGDPMIGPVPVIAAMLAFSARENAEDRAPALVEAAVAEMRERAAKVVDHYHDQIAEVLGQKDLSARVLGQIVPMIQLAGAMRAAIRALPTPSQEASNVG